MANFFRRIVRPARKQSIFRTERAGASGVGRVFAGLVVCLIVTGLLSSQRLVAMAERQEFGPSRDRWLSAAEAVNEAATAVRLDRPAAIIESALGRSSGDEPLDVVFGELAVPDPPTLTPSVAPVPTTSDMAQPSSVAPTPTTTTPTTTTPTTTALLPALGDVSIDNPLRIWIGGDSLGEYVGSQLLYQVAEPELSDVELDFVISTGLARPDYFDWPARLSEIMQRPDRPDVVVYMVGGNDDQDLQVDGERAVLGTDAWREAYRERVATMMDVAAYPDVQMLWINLPPMRDERRQAVADDINQTLEAEASIRPWVDVVEIVEMFTGSSGGFDQFIVEPDGTATQRARANDGVHITRSASAWVAEVVWTHIGRRWRFEALATSTTAAPSVTPEPGATNGSSTTTASADGGP